MTTSSPSSSPVLEKNVDGTDVVSSPSSVRQTCFSRIRQNGRRTFGSAHKDSQRNNKEENRGEENVGLIQLENMKQPKRTKRPNFGADDDESTQPETDTMSNSEREDEESHSKGTETREGALSTKNQELVSEPLDFPKDNHGQDKEDDTVDGEESLMSASDAGDEDDKGSTQSEPDDDAVRLSIDFAFFNADEETVTLRDIVAELEDDYDASFLKAKRKMIGEYFTKLLNEQKAPMPGSNNINSSEKEDENCQSKENDPDTMVATSSSAEEDNRGQGEDEESVQEKGSVLSTKTDEEEEDDKESTKSEPTDEAICLSVDYAFLQADKETVTVRDIVTALEAEYDISFSKAKRKLIREHLVKLVTKKVQPSIEKRQSDDESDSEQESDPPSDYEEEIKRDTKKGKGKRRSKPSSKGQQRSKRQLKESKKKSALRAKAEKTRQRRLQELRVRNEELQLNEKLSKEDQERSELIAAKFETNTDEMRVQRLEDRLDLLGKLDAKRLIVIQEKELKELEVKAIEDEASVEGTKDGYDPHSKTNPKATGDSDEESDSDDDMELEIVGKEGEVVAPFSLRQQATAKQSVLDSLFARADAAKKNKKTKKAFGNQPQASPGRSINARASLRNQLLAKQRQAGNRWLALELGYKTEEDHLRDCLKEETKKRDRILKAELARTTRNREKLRDRLEQPDAEDIQEEPDNPSKSADEDEEEDEEVELAREIEQEKTQNENFDVPDADYINHSDGMNDTLSKEEGSSLHETELSTEKQDVDSPPSEALNDSIASHDTQPPPLASHETVANKMNGRVVSIGSTHEDVGVDSQDLETQPPTVPMYPEGGMSPEEAIAFVSQESKDAAKIDSKAKESGLQSEEGAPEDNGSKVTAQDDPIEEEFEKPKKVIRNAGWQAMLRKEQEKLKKMKRRNGNSDLLEMEAEEEEDEEEVAGLEDFGFSVIQKKDDDDDNVVDSKVNEDDLKHIVDEVSDDEGDEEVGEQKRREMEKAEEKRKHVESLRRMRDGYDGRRGGIASGGMGARGVHRFDELVAPDNREDAKQLGLLNDDELDSDDEAGKKGSENDVEDEAALVDKMLKDRFLARNNVETEEFSEDEDDEDDVSVEQKDDEEEKEQNRLAKRFSKRARMQRLIENFGESQEFSNSRLIEEDTNMQVELRAMKNGLVRKRSQSSASRASSQGSVLSQNGTSSKRGQDKMLGSFISQGSSLSIALKANLRKPKRQGFQGRIGSSDYGSSAQKNISFGHVVFDSQLSRSQSINTTPALVPTKPSGKRKLEVFNSHSSLWSKVVSNGSRRDSTK